MRGGVGGVREGRRGDSQSRKSSSPRQGVQGDRSRRRKGMVEEEAPRIGGERATDITLLLLPTGASSGPCLAVVDGATERSGSRTDQQLQQHNYNRSYRAHQNQQMCQKSLFISSPSFIHSFLLSLLPSLPPAPSFSPRQCFFFFFFQKKLFPVPSFSLL